MNIGELVSLFLGFMAGGMCALLGVLLVSILHAIRRKED